MSDIDLPMNLYYHIRCNNHAVGGTEVVRCKIIMVLPTRLLQSFDIVTREM